MPTYPETARQIADAISVANPDSRTLERLACEIRIANGIHTTALLDPAQDPGAMLSAALAVSFALHGIVDTQQVMITRYSAASGCVTFASLCIQTLSAGCVAERRLHTAPVPELAAYVWVPPPSTPAAAEILSSFGEVTKLWPHNMHATGQLQVVLDLERFRVPM